MQVIEHHILFSSMHVDIALTLILYSEASHLLSLEKYFLWLNMVHPEAEVPFKNSFT